MPEIGQQEDRQAKSFTMFNSKEIHRAILNLDPKAFVVFLTLVRLIVKFKYNNKYRQLSVQQILKALPIKISAPTLKKYLDMLRKHGFIKSFQDTETKHHVYSLIHQIPSVGGGHSKIDDEILTETLESIHHAHNIKLFILIYLNLTSFSHENGFVKALKDLCQLMGLKPTKGHKDMVSCGLDNLTDLGLIHCTSFQKHIFLDKKITINLGTKPQLPAKTMMDNNFDQCQNAPCIQKNERHEEKILNTRNENLNDIYIKKENIFKNQNISKKELGPTVLDIKFTLQIPNEEKAIDNLIFNFFGLDKLENPFNTQSVKTLLKKTDLTLKQIQDSVQRFSKTLENAKNSNGELTINDPAAFIVNHLISRGEYFPKPQKIACKFGGFDFCGLDELDNPFSSISLQNILKATNLTQDQIQESVKNFSAYLNSDVYEQEFSNPTACLYSHLKRFGVYIPPERYYERKKYESFSENDYTDILINAMELSTENQVFDRGPSKEELEYCLKELRECLQIS